MRAYAAACAWFIRSGIVTSNQTSRSPRLRLLRRRNPAARLLLLAAARKRVILAVRARVLSGRRRTAGDIAFQIADGHRSAAPKESRSCFARSEERKQAACQKITETRRSPESRGFQPPSTRAEPEQRKRRRKSGVFYNKQPPSEPETTTCTT